MVQHTEGDDPFARPGESLDATGASAGGPGADMYCDPVALDIKVQEQLGKVFRAYCDDLIQQPIPEKFVVLLARLEAKQREKR